MIELQRDALIDAYYTLLERLQTTEADLAAAREREQQAARLRAALERICYSDAMYPCTCHDGAPTHRRQCSFDAIRSARAALAASQSAPAAEAQDDAPRPYLCVTCGGQYRSERLARLRCAVMHAEGACCHMSEIEVTPPPPRGGQAEREG
jgi:hypothetical protein